MFALEIGHLHAKAPMTVEYIVERQNEILVNGFQFVVSTRLALRCGLVLARAQFIEIDEYKNAMILNFGLVAFRNHGTTRLFPRAESAFNVGDVF